MRKFTSLFCIVLFALILISCSDNPNSNSVGYELTFKYSSGQVTLYANDGDIVTIPSIPSVVNYQDEIGEYTAYFTNRWVAYRLWVEHRSYLEGSSFKFDSEIHYWNFVNQGLNPPVWYAVYSKALTLDDGTNVQTILCDTDDLFFILESLLDSNVTQKDNCSFDGWVLKCSEPITYSSFSFNQIIIRKEEAESLKALLNSDKNIQDVNHFSYGEGASPEERPFREYFFKTEEEQPNIEVDAFLDNELVGTIPLMDSKEYYYHFKDIHGYNHHGVTSNLTSFIGSNNDVTLYRIYKINSVLLQALTRDPFFSVYWEPYPVVSFINGTNTSQSSVAPNTCVQKPDDPSKDGFKFMWWSQNEAGEAFDFNTPIAENTNLYAVFKQLFTVTFVNEGLTSTVQVAYGEYAGKLNPTRTGYVLKGWSLTNGGALFNFETTPITDNTTLYAVWEEE